MLVHVIWMQAELCYLTKPHFAFEKLSDPFKKTRNNIVVHYNVTKSHKHIHFHNTSKPMRDSLTVIVRHIT